MGTISYAQVPPTSATIALNAYIFGFGGHSLVTPHVALKQLWWTDDRIESKVTRKFVVSQIKGEERDFLDRPLAFGEGLTDDTYMGWILGRARRLFLILAEVGKPEQIFGLIDDSMDDDDLPFSLESIAAMDLSIEPDERLNKKFYGTQFLYLLRQLKENGHIDYGPHEHIPMERVHKVPPAVALQSWDRIHFPKESEQVFLRRKFNIGAGPDKEELRATYLQDVAEAKRLKHPHIARLWASYSSGDAGYTLSDFVPEHTLSSFIAHRTPYQFMRVSQIERPVILLEWMHCLADALAMLHHRGIHHGAIRPSNILVDHENCIAFADVGSLRTFQRGKKVSKTEMQDYAAPETSLDQTARVHFSENVTSVNGKRWSASSNLSGNSISSGLAGPKFISSPILISSSGPMSPVDSPMNSFSSPSMPAPIPLFRNFSRHLPPPPTIASASGRPSSMSRHESYSASPPESPGRLQHPLLDPGRFQQNSFDTGSSKYPSLDPGYPPGSPKYPSLDPGYPRYPSLDPGSPKYPSLDPGYPKYPYLDPGSSKYSSIDPRDAQNYSLDPGPSKYTISDSKHYSLDPGSLKTPPLDPDSMRYPSADPSTPKHPSFASSNNSSSNQQQPIPPQTQISPQSILLSSPLVAPRPLFAQKNSSQQSLNTIRSAQRITATGQESDIFSLGCVYLDIVTFIVKGKLSDLHKFRHSNPDMATDPSTLHTWLAHLASDSVRLAPVIPILSALPPILGVVRDMLGPNPETRPSATGVTERVLGALEQAGLSRLCCRDAGWSVEDEGVVRKPRRSTRNVVVDGDAVQVSGARDDREGVGIAMKRARSEGPVGGKVGRMRKLGLSWRRTHVKGV